MSRTLHVLTSAAALVAGAALLPATTRAAPSGTVTLVSDPGDYIGAERPRLFTSENATMRFGGDSGYPTLSVMSPKRDGYTWSFDFAAPPGTLLRRGVWTGGTRAPFHGGPGLDVSGEHRGCNRLTGEFDVKEFALDSRGEISRLWALYEQHCETGLEAAFGEVKVGFPATGALTAAPSIVRWPATFPGGLATVVPVTFTAGRSIRITSTSVVGAAKTSFAVDRDSCTGTTVKRGRNCQVVVRMSPVVAGTRTATLRLTDSRGMRHAVPLQAFIYGGRTQLEIQSEPGDEIANGGTYSYSSFDAKFLAGASPDVVAMGVAGGGDDGWALRFTAVEGTPLAPGRYANATRAHSDDSRPGLEIDGQNRRCADGRLSGEFTVSEFELDPFRPDALKRFAATFEQRCDGASGTLRGTVAYRAGDNVAPAQWLKPTEQPKAIPATGRCAERDPEVSMNELRGTKRSERIRGNRYYRDAVLGGPGDDVIWGHELDDCLDGGAGDDRLDGGPGEDVLICGAGRDTARVTKGDSVRGCERVIR